MFPFGRVFLGTFFLSFSISVFLFSFFWTFRLLLKPSDFFFKCGGESINIPIKKHSYNGVVFRWLTIHKWSSVVNNLIIYLMCFINWRVVFSGSLDVCFCAWGYVLGVVWDVSGRLKGKTECVENWLLRPLAWYQAENLIWLANAMQIRRPVTRCV